MGFYQVTFKSALIKNKSVKKILKKQIFVDIIKQETCKVSDRVTVEEVVSSDTSPLILHLC